MVGSGFGVDVDFVKLVTDAHGKRGPARTWIASSTGTIGRPSGYSESYIMSTLSEHLDEFILKYLRVNEADCQN